MPDLEALGFLAPPPEWPVIEREIGGRPVRLTLGIKDLVDLERHTGLGISAILLRFQRMEVGTAEIVQPILMALSRGGDCTGVEALAVVRTFVEPNLASHVRIAADIVSAAFAGMDVADTPPDDTPGEP